MNLADVSRLMHLVFLSIWGGIVITEAVLELVPLRRRELLKSTVEFHYFIDIYLELPVILLVICTGAVNLFLVKITALILLKAAAACVAIGANLFCITEVIKRRSELMAGAGEQAIASRHRKVILSAVVGGPFAAAAIALGLYIAATLQPVR